MHIQAHLLQLELLPALGNHKNIVGSQGYIVKDRSESQLNEKTLDQISSKGLDDLVFLMSANKGHQPQPLNKVVSGGELSRISLVLHVFVCPEHLSQLPGVYCFDEVDVGVSGHVATAIGELLEVLAQRHQVFCISHAPQVAARRACHWLISKQKHKEVVESHWSQLNEAGRVDEISRMFGANSEQSAALAQKLLAASQPMHLSKPKAKPQDLKKAVKTP